jgi:acetyl/propionyl-CoA carboxylase alpha subunit
MKLRAESNGHSYLLEILPLEAAYPDGLAKCGSAKAISYTLKALDDENPGGASAGTASVMEVMPGVFSVLEDNTSFLIRLSPGLDETLDVSWGTTRFSIALGDLRDQAPRKKSSSEAGPQELRALMPGKVVKILVTEGERVSAGQGVIMVEAMKMQNEMKSPKDGVVSRISTSDGATVAAGATLLIIE